MKAKFQEELRLVNLIHLIKKITFTAAVFELKVIEIEMWIWIWHWLTLCTIIIRRLTPPPKYRTYASVNWVIGSDNGLSPAQCEAIT